MTENTMQKSTPHIIRTIGGASIGNVLEWYDFGVYAFFAVVISKVIFGGIFAALLLTFLAYGIGFVLRPVGSGFFAQIGDRMGRKNALLLTFWVMGAGTILTGLIPTYAVIGIFAPIILTLARVIQGFGAGGEWGGAGVYLAELGGKTKRGFYSSLQQTFVLASVLIAILTGLVVDAQPSSFVDSIGWRLPFIIGGIILIPLSFYLRSKMPETQDFENLKYDKKVIKSPVKKAFTKDLRITLIVLFGTAGVTAEFYILVEYIASFIETTTNLGVSVSFYVPAVIEIAMLPMIPIFGYLSDKWKTRKKLFWIGTLGAIIVVFPEFILIGTGNLIAIYGISVITGVLLAVGAGTLVAFIGEQFPTNDRYSGYISYNIAASYFGGFGPFVATALILVVHNNLAPAIWVVVVGVISLIAIYFSKETGHLEKLPEETSLYVESKS